MNQHNDDLTCRCYATLRHGRWSQWELRPVKDKNLRYDVVLAGLKKEFADLSPSDWNRNAYWSWLYALPDG